MNCECGVKTRTIEVYNGKNHRTRRRKCPDCGKRFTTKEYRIEDFNGVEKLHKKLETANTQIAKLESFQKAVLGTAIEFSEQQ